MRWVRMLQLNDDNQWTTSKWKWKFIAERHRPTVSGNNTEKSLTLSWDSTSFASISCGVDGGLRAFASSWTSWWAAATTTLATRHQRHLPDTTDNTCRCSSVPLPVRICPCSGSSGTSSACIWLFRPAIVGN